VKGVKPPGRDVAITPPRPKPSPSRRAKRRRRSRSKSTGTRSSSPTKRWRSPAHSRNKVSGRARRGSRATSAPASIESPKDFEALSRLQPPSSVKTWLSPRTGTTSRCMTIALATTCARGIRHSKMH